MKKSSVHMGIDVNTNIKCLIINRTFRKELKFIYRLKNWNLIKEYKTLFLILEDWKFLEKFFNKLFIL